MFIRRWVPQLLQEKAAVLTVVVGPALRRDRASSKTLLSPNFFCSDSNNVVLPAPGGPTIIRMEAGSSSSNSCNVWLRT